MIIQDEMIFFIEPKCFFTMVCKLMFHEQIANILLFANGT